MVKTHRVTLIAVLLGGLGIGAALAGRPTTPANDVRITSVPSTTIATPTTIAHAPTTTAPERSAATTSAVTTVAVAPTPTTPATVIVATTTTVAEATTTTDPGPDRSNVLVLVANAGDASGIARAEAARLATLGYPPPVTADATERLAETSVFARIGREDEARLLLADVGLPADRLLPFPDQSITTLDDRANVILALGLDWQA